MKILVLPKWVPINESTLPLLKQEVDPLSHLIKFGGMNITYRNLSINIQFRLYLEALMSIALEVDYKTNFNYLSHLDRINRIIPPIK